MKVHNIDQEQEYLAFAKEAGEWFSTHPGDTTFTHSEVEGGCLFAVRWNNTRGSVLVFRLAEDFEFEPTIYERIIAESAPAVKNDIVYAVRALAHQVAIDRKSNLTTVEEDMDYIERQLANIIDAYPQKETL